MKKTEKELLGVIPRERIKTIDVNRPSKDVIQDFLQFEDMSGYAARTLDSLGIWGSINSAVLHPLIPGKKLVGPAITVRDVPSRISHYYGIVTGAQSIQKGESEAYFVGEPGDVIVIDSGGQSHASSMGGGSAKLAKSRGIAGFIVDGVCTGIPGIKRVDLPMWCRGGTTVTGHHRLDSVEINGTISCAGVQVQPGDLMVADDSGIAVIPFNMITEVLELMKTKSSINTQYEQLIERVRSGESPLELGKLVAKMGKHIKDY